MIESSERLREFLASCHGGGPAVCAIDTEADSLHRYRESLCLIQFAAQGEPVLIDPLAIDDLSPFGEYLTQATVWMHGADYDMTMFKREFGALPPTIYDTQIGARLLGARKFGLGDLVQQFFGIELSKSSQKADWGKRPLSEKMIEYARNDVRYLLEMGDLIVTKLTSLGRLEWFLESCEAARLKVLERDENRDDCWRIQGSGKLDRFQLACLREIWRWRDAEAMQWDRPSFMVATNSQLIEWTLTISTRKPLELPHHFRPDRVRRLQEAVNTAFALPEAEWPERIVGKRRKRDKEFDQRVDAFIAKRTKVADQLGIEPSLIASRAVLESIAAAEVRPDEVLLRWQRECLGSALG
jgi:ribonuclease D